MSSPRKWSVSFVSVALSLTLLASACSGSKNDASRSASAAAGNPVELPALASTSATGERVPMWYGAVVRPDSWVSSSLSPTLALPDGTTGAWTFKLSDLSGGMSSFGTREYKETGTSARIPLGILQDQNVYTWTAESPGQNTVGGSFTVDTQLVDVQNVDTVGDFESNLSSGEAAYSWSSHAMQSLGGAVGIGLRFQGSNVAEAGMPAGWKLQAASGSPFTSVVTRPDGSIGLVAKNGQVSTYLKGAGDLWNPVKSVGDTLDTSGTAPVIIQNVDGSYSVTTKGATSLFVDDNASGISHLSGVSSDGKPMLQQSWKSGLLRSITDPVSGRSIELVYGGGSCPKIAAGFVAAPNDMLCQVKFWDGSTSAISYVKLADGSASIGRMTDYPDAGAAGALVSDVAYDAAGRISQTRSPLIAVAAASNLIGADDVSYFTEATYTPEGRVASVTSPAPSVGGTRCSRTYVNEGSLTSVNDSCFGKQISSVLFDPTTFFPSVETNALGQQQTSDFNLTTGELRSMTDYTGLVTLNRYENGLLVETKGPSRNISNSQITLRQYDETYASSADGVAMKGLDVTYWPSATDRTANAIMELGPTVNDQLQSSLTINWDASPAGTSGGWSALMTGALRITTPGTYSFASGNTNAKLRIANLNCDNGSCANVELPAEPVSIRADITSTTSQSSIDLTWSGPDTGGISQSIPTDRLTPQYGYATEKNTVDPTAVRSNSENISRSSYANPAQGLLTSRTNGGNSTSSIAYETAGWKRNISSTLPAGNVMRSTWWGDKESAKSSCPGAKSAVQGGAAKQTITPGPDGGDGPSAQQWYDAAGRVVASVVANGITECTTRDSAGRVASIETIGMGAPNKTVFDYAVGGNPLIATATSTQGNDVTTVTTEIDLAGRVVRSIDRFGVVTLSTYDVRTGQISSVATTPSGGASTVSSNSYDEFGRLATQTVDGRVLATIGYDVLSLPNSVAYGNGSKATFEYDDTNRLIATTRTTSDGKSFVSRFVLSAAGTPSSLTLSAAGQSSTFEYTHDANERLSAVTVSAGLIPARTWSYSYDANSNRIGQTQTAADGRVTRFASVYDKADRLVSTDDPAASGEITYDNRGNATKIGPDSFTYDAANDLVQATDGTTTIAYQRDVNGNIYAKTTTDASGSTTINYASNGLLLDQNKMPTAQIIGLPGGVQFTKSMASSVPARWEYQALNGDRFFSADDAGVLTGTISVFDPFGNRLTVSTVANPNLPDLGWLAETGNETGDLKTSFIMMGSRVYLPALGRFIQLDPVPGGSANGYDYVNQSPLMGLDSSGEADSDTWNYIGMGLVALAAIATSLVVPAGAFGLGAKGAMVAGAVAGVLAATVNSMVQFSTGSMDWLTMATFAVGILAGLGSGAIAGKVKWARFQKASAAQSSKSGGVASWADLMSPLKKNGGVAPKTNIGATGNRRGVTLAIKAPKETPPVVPIGAAKQSKVIVVQPKIVSVKSEIRVKSIDSISQSSESESLKKFDFGGYAKRNAKLYGED